MSAPAILSLRDVSFSYYKKPILTDVTFHLYKKDKVCLIGQNGSGKSSLLKLLAGQLTLDAGHIFQQPHLTLSYLSQNPPMDPSKSIQNYVLEAAQKHPLFTEEVRFQANSLLEELGLSCEKEMGTLSGGELRRASLIATLIQPADVFLLDEPTNHLDIVAIEWLEQWMRRSQKTFIVVSHDRTFLKHVTTKTLWLEQKHLYVCPEGFSQFEAWQENFLLQQQHALAKLDQRLSEEMHWLHRGVTARRRRNQGRLRALQALRAQRTQALHQIQTKAVRLEASDSVIETRQLLMVDGISYAHKGHRPLFENLSFRLLKGDRLGIIGPNGCGKSTLINVLLGHLAPTQGKVYRPKTLSYGLFEQEQPLDILNKTPWQFLCPEGGDSICVQGKQRHVVAYLKEFLFTPDEARTEIGLLSGGQRNRLRLAKVLARTDPLLILDEPTNDLDIETLDFLQDFLSTYPGTLILISHDRDFLDQVSTSLLVFANPLREYCGSFSEYLEEHRTSHPFYQKPAISKKIQSPEKSIRAPKVTDRLSYHQIRLLEILPEEIDALEEEKQELQERMALLAQEGDHEGLSLLAPALQEIEAKISKTEEQWLSLCALEDALKDD